MTSKKIGRPPAGHVKATVSLTPAQLQLLREEAFRRAAADPRARPDVSAVLRELVDAWAKRRK